jgi:hypothetical protein
MPVAPVANNAIVPVSETDSDFNWDFISQNKNNKLLDILRNNQNRLNFDNIHENKNVLYNIQQYYQRNQDIDNNIQKYILMNN